MEQQGTVPADADLLTLRVEHSESAADGVQLFEFRDPAGAALPPFAPGAHIALQVPNGATRTYSLCNDPAERDRYVIAVKREPSGRGGSISLIDGLRPGDTVSASYPRNLFGLVDSAPGYVFVAGGIGITPILSMIRHIRATSGKPFHLYYLSRSPAGAAFLDVLADPALQGHVTVHHDEGDPDRAFDLWPVFEQPTKTHIYCCGPRPLMDAVRDMTGHWPTSAVHFEDFGSDLVRPRDGDMPFTVALARSGGEFEVAVGASALEVMRAHGLRVPSSCESGTCGTCRTRVLEGTVDHRDMVLSPAERRSEMMVCVSRGQGRIVLDA